MAHPRILAQEDFFNHEIRKTHEKEFPFAYSAYFAVQKQFLRIWDLLKGLRGFNLSSNCFCRNSIMMKEHERVVLKTAVPSEALKAGDVGTVVHVYRDGLAYEVEFTTLDGKTAAVVTVEAAQIRPVRKREITHARALAPA
jgi:hypothetical protein